MQMKAFGLLALAVSAGCAPPQTADPAPVLASQADLTRIRQAIAPCLKKAWVLPAKGQPSRVTLRWRLDEDGRLVGDPEIVDPEVSAYAPVAQAATRAVRACEPFRLPVAQYHLWKEIVYNFDAMTMSR
jgi:hypothetical protein